VPFTGNVIEGKKIVVAPLLVTLEPLWVTLNILFFPEQQDLIKFEMKAKQLKEFLKYNLNGR
jgi:hypothetical protein